MVIFLLAVFFVFATFGFINDVLDMGRQPPLRFALAVLLSGSFAVCYAIAGFTLRGQFWKAFVPVFAAQFLLMGLAERWLPEPPEPLTMGTAAIGLLQQRLLFDGIGVIVSICLGYAGFVFVSVTEAKRHVLAETAKALLESEMSAAREVQRVMVPESLPLTEGYSIESIYRPAAEVGGDFFQVIPLKSGSALVVVGDVSGKGLRAAMIVSMIVGTVQTVSGYTEEPAEILRELNLRLCGRMQEGFATCVAVRLGEQGKLTLANAGHLPPCRNGTELSLAGSLPLGLTKAAAYEQTSLEMAIGDSVVLLTDGIAEAQDAQRILFGFARVESMLREGAMAKDIADAAQLHGQNDDLTVLRIERVL